MSLGLVVTNGIIIPLNSLFLNGIELFRLLKQKIKQEQNKTILHTKMLGLNLREKGIKKKGDMNEV